MGITELILAIVKSKLMLRFFRQQSKDICSFVYFNQEGYKFIARLNDQCKVS